jgi:hypothetical protein
MSQRTKYFVLPSPYGWEGMMEGALRASVAAKSKEEVLERTIELAKRREPSSVIVHNECGTFDKELIYGDGS